MIESNYTNMNFTIFETRQFNEFMNFQIGKNTIMVSVVKLPTELYENAPLLPKS